MLEPAIGRQFAGRRRHPADHIAQRGCDLGLVEPEFRQFGFEPKPAQRLERCMLDPDTARPDQIERAQIHVVEALSRAGAAAAPTS